MTTMPNPDRSFSAVRTVPVPLLALAAIILSLATPVGAQDRLRSMPGYERYQEMAPQIQGSFVSGALQVTWSDDGSGFEIREMVAPSSSTFLAVRQPMWARCPQSIRIGGAVQRVDDSSTPRSLQTE